MYASRKQCEALIKMGKSKSDTIREFKRKLKTSRIS
jgi:hypothetical protein